MIAFSCQFSKVTEADKKRRRWQEGVFQVKPDQSIILKDHLGAKIFGTKLKSSQIAAAGEELCLGMYDVQIDVRIAGDGLETESVPSSSVTFISHTNKKPKLADFQKKTIAPPLSKHSSLSKTQFRSPQIGSSLSSSLSSQTAPRVPALSAVLSNPSTFRPPISTGMGSTQSSNSVQIDSISNLAIDNILLRKMRPHQVTGAHFLLDCLKGRVQQRSKNGDEKGNKQTAPVDDDNDDDDFILPTSPAQPSASKVEMYTGAILADEMGLGKTLQAISVLSAFTKTKRRRGIIICPSSLIENWRNEMRKWMSVSMDPLLIQPGSKPTPIEKIRAFSTNTRNYVMIISYEMFRKNIDEINQVAGLEVIVLDEAHKIKSFSETKTTAAFRTCTAKRRLLLTGSPIQNNLDELFSLVSFAAPGFLGSISSYRRKFALPIHEANLPHASKSTISHGQAAALKLRFLLSQIMLRRTQAEILKRVLPPRIDVVLFCALSVAQKAEYMSVARTMIGEKAVLESEQRVNPGAEDNTPGIVNSSHSEVLDTELQGAILLTGNDPSLEEAIEGAPFLPTELVLPSLQKLRRICNFATQIEQLVASNGSFGSSDIALKIGCHQQDIISTRADTTCLEEENLLNTLPAPVPVPKPGRFRPPSRIISNAPPPPPREPISIPLLLQQSSKFYLLDMLLQTIRQSSPHEKVVIVSNFTVTLDLVEALAASRGYQTLMLQGNIPIDQRQSLVDRFNRPSDPAFLFLLSSRAGGVGINLPGGSRLVSMDVDWNPAVDIQAMARIWREGQKRPTFIYRLCSAGVMEECILRRQYDKGGLVTSVMQDDAPVDQAECTDTTDTTDTSNAPPDAPDSSVFAPVPHSKHELETLIFPSTNYSAGGPWGRVMASYEHDPVLKTLLENMSDLGNAVVTRVVECTR